METALSPKENWEQKYQEAVSLGQQIRAKGSDMYGTDSRWKERVTSIILPHLIKFAGVETIEDLRKFAAFHPLLGSSVDFDSHPDLDLPDGEIMSFLQVLLEKLNEADNTGRYDKEWLG
ncbi:MAG: hypothetical protein WC640_00600 [Candidatus Paceibacterota bacterium]|jgi:hypothetical protein